MNFESAYNNHIGQQPDSQPASQPVPASVGAPTGGLDPFQGQDPLASKFQMFFVSLKRFANELAMQDPRFAAEVDAMAHKFNQEQQARARRFQDAQRQQAVQVIRGQM